LAYILLQNLAMPNTHMATKKFETYASIFISVMLFLVSYDILKNALFRFFHPTTPRIDLTSFIIMMVTLGINVFVFKYEYSAGKN